MVRTLQVIRALILWSVLWATHKLWGQVPGAAELLPESTLVYVEWQPARLVDRVMSHPLVRRIEASPQYQEALANAQFTQLRAAVTFVEARLEKSWQEILRAMTGRGQVLAFDPQTNGWIILGSADEPSVPVRFRDAVLDLVRYQARERGQPDPIRSAEYRGIIAHQVNQVKVAVFDEWYLVTNRSELGKAVLDNYLDKNTRTFASKTSFREARQVRRSGSDAWAFADLDGLRRSGAASELFSGKAENPVAELLVGGLLDPLKHAPYAAADWVWEDSRVAFRVYLPLKTEWISEPRQYFFGSHLAHQAGPLLRPAGTVLSVSTHRDLSQFWLRAPDLFDKETNDQLAQAESMLTTLFSGHDFGRDILGAFQPQLQLVVARQQFSPDQPIPTVRLPAVALVGTLREPDTMRRELRRIFQSLIGFLNIVNAMQGQPQLELDEQRDDDLHLVLARFVREADRSQTAPVSIHYNFAPTLGFHGSRFVLATSPTLACQVLQDCPTLDVPQGTNTAVWVDPEPLCQILLDNRNALVSQGILERGRSRQEAEQEFDLFLGLLRAFDGFRMQLVAEQALVWEWELRFRTISLDKP